LRGLGVYHGKKGSGISVEAKVQPGAVTTLNVTQTRDGRLKFIVSEAEAMDYTIMKIGNTQTHVKFNCDPDIYMSKWFAEAPTHHCALAVGHNADVLVKLGELMDIPTVVL
jgi:L-arabinose isomerase